MKLENKIVVVTGAGSGMGRELVLALLRARARVAAIDVNERTLAETAALAAEHHASLATFVASIADRAAVEALPNAVVARFGAVDGLINCAGIIQPFVDLADLDYAVIDRIFDVNWRGTLYMTKTFLPLLRARPEAHLVNISSMGGFMPFPGQTAYGASKAAVKLLTEGLRLELAGTSVRVTLVYPGAVATNIAVNSGVNMQAGAGAKGIYPADRAARDILAGIERNKARILIGKDAKALDALYRLSPQRSATFIAEQMKKLLKGSTS
jgi:NAD(P)-dependent dehydrogenase (short-subunit alcohol dehydrogenase family)